MSTNLEKEITRLDIRQQPVDGLEIAPGCVRTSGGFVIRTPKSKLKKQTMKQQTQAEATVTKLATQSVLQAPEPAAAVHVQTERRPVYREPEQQVTFTTPVGSISGKYWPVIDAGDYVVLGLTEQSFVPSTYKEAPDMKLQLKADKLDVCVVYTGCRFTDPDIEREYIVMLKVTNA